MVRSKVSASADNAVAEDEVYLSINLLDGRKLEKHIKHATGAPTNPMTDEALNEN